MRHALVLANRRKSNLRIQSSRPSVRPSSALTNFYLSPPKRVFRVLCEVGKLDLDPPLRRQARYGPALESVRGLDRLARLL